MRRTEWRYWSAVGGLLLAPALHPLLIPLIGVPSHLLWWVHVLPIALVSFRYGRRGAARLVPLSTALVIAGERLFGAGYGVPAPWETAWSLAAALTATHILVAGFALHARATSRRYQLLFDHAASAILRTHAEGRLIRANPAALRLFNCRWDEIRGRRFADVPWLAHVPAPDDIPPGGWSGVITVGCRGQESDAHVLVAAIRDDDPPGHQILVVDRTTEVVQEREMVRQGHLAALGEALAGVAHELKNPLQVIGGYGELALMPGTTTEEIREALEIIRGQAQRMRNLLQELLGFSREGTQQARVRLDRLVGRLLRMQRVARGGAVRFDERLRWHGEVEVSAAKLEQVLLNLLSNAVDAAPAAGGVVEVELRSEDGYVLIEVADNGPGIDSGVAERIFEPFVTTKPEGMGTGLGLAICRRLATSMGGTITVANRPGGGAVFTLRLPLLRTTTVPEHPRPESVPA